MALDGERSGRPGDSGGSALDGVHGFEAPNDASHREIERGAKTCVSDYGAELLDDE